MPPTHYDYLLAFLMNYDIIHFFGTYDNLLKSIFEAKKLPIDLLTFKFFEYMLFKNKEVDEIYNLFKGDDSNETNTTESDTECIVRMLDLLKNKQIKFVHFNLVEYDNNVKCFNIPKQQVQQAAKIEVPEVVHTGYPIPDPEKGRPQLNWCQCAFPNCGKQFTSAMALVNHLTKCNVYTEGFHYYHENAVLELAFSPEKVIAENITKCPSLACNHKDFETPQLLIEHLVLLGIEPFWTKGTVIENKDVANPTATTVQIKKEPKVNYDIHYPKLFEVEQCLLCLTERPQVVAGNCRHHIVCRDCFVGMNVAVNTKVCPMCRTQVNIFYPFY